MYVGASLRLLDRPPPPVFMRERTTYLHFNLSFPNIQNPTIFEPKFYKCYNSTDAKQLTQNYVCIYIKTSHHRFFLIAQKVCTSLYQDRENVHYHTSQQRSRWLIKFYSDAWILSNHHRYSLFFLIINPCRFYTKRVCTKLLINNIYILQRNKEVQHEKLHRVVCN